MPQAVAAAAAWVGSTVGTAVGASLTAAGVVGSTALPLALAAANAAYFVAEIGMYIGLQGLINDIANEKRAPQGYELNLRNAADVPREMIIGQRPVAGSVIARYSRGANLYNAHFVYQLADHPCVELSKVYGDGRLVRSTPLTHGTRTEITAYSYSGGPRVWMTWHDGRPGQTADSDLITKSAQDPDVVAGVYGGWTSNHRGAGCAYVHVEVQFDSDILTSIPEFLFDVKGAKLYDRRKDTTAGGSGAHRHNDPSTWEWTANAAVALDHYMLGYKVEDDDLAFGAGLSPLEVPYATFAALADLCDEDVVTGEGGAAVTIKRAEANGIISSAAGFEDTIENLANQMNAKVVDLGGQIGVLGAEERTTVVDLDDDDWANDESVRYAPKLAFSDLYGGVVGSFPDPENLWQPTPYERQETSYLQLPDGGEAPIGQLDLPFETNSRRAVRIAAAWLKRESLQPRLAGTFATRSNAWRLAPGDWFNFSSTRLGVTNEKFEVVDTVRHEDFTVTVTARAINPDFLAFSVADDPSLGVPPVLAPYNLLLDLPEFDVEVTTLVAGGIVEPAIEFTLTSDETVAREVVIEYAKWDTIGLDIIGPSFVDSIHTSQIVTKIRKGILPSTPYVFRAKAKAGVRESEWTDWSAPITTGGTYTVGEASSVPWSGVTDSGGRPDDNADVTAANTAAAIASQGAFATLSSAAYGSGLLTGFGGLAALAFATLGTNIRRADGTTVPTEAQVITSLGVAASIASQGAFATLSSAAYGSGLLTGFGSLAALAFTTIGTNTRRADGTTVATESMLVTSLGVAATISGQGAFATVNTAAYGSALLTGFGTVAALSSITGLTAGSITGQGAFATISSAAYGSALLTGFGSLAALAFTTIGTNTRRADGTTVATESMLVTSLGVAATISGQGAFATVNTAAYGSGLLTGFGTVAALSSITGLTAGGITGQGSLATLSSLAYGGAYLTGFGSLAALAYTTIGTNTRRADGTTVATEAMLVTSLGVAATISGQGAFATISSAAYGSGYLTGFGTVAALSSITGLTAGSVTGQGALATLSSLAYGGAYLTGFGSLAALSNGSSLTAGAITGQGGLATLSFVQLNTNVRLADGTTVATEAMVVTASGVAASIAGQGSLATISIVNTTNINTNAASYGAQTETDADITTTTSWADIASLTGFVVGSGEEVDLFFSAAIRAIASYAAGIGGSTVEWRLLRDATEIYSPTTLGSIDATDLLLNITSGGIEGLYDTSIGQQSYAHPSGMDFDTPSAGTYSYYLQAKHVGDKAWTISKRRLKAVLRKR